VLRRRRREREREGEREEEYGRWEGERIRVGRFFPLALGAPPTRAIVAFFSLPLCLTRGPSNGVGTRESCFWARLERGSLAFRGRGLVFEDPPSVLDGIGLFRLGLLHTREKV
jgi:hypothetical protein